MKINAIGFSTKALMTIVISFLGFGLWGQSLIDETLRSGSLPTGWTAVDVAFPTAAGGYANLSGNTAVLTTPVFNASAFASIDLDFSVAKFGAGTNGPLTIEYSLDGGDNWILQGNSSTPTDATYQPNSISISAASATMQVRFTTVNSPSNKRLRDVVIEGVGTAGTPAISFNVANVSNLDYQFGSGPSTAQSYEVSGSNLVGSGNISISAPTNFEVSLDNTSFGPSESLPFTSGQITGQPVTVYVRLASSLAVNTYNGNIEHTGGGATQTDLAVFGEVTSPPPSISTLGQAGAYFENFQNFISLATLPNGWSISGSITTYAGNWGAGTAAGLRGNDTVLGYQHTGTTGTFISTLTLENATGISISTLNVSYLGRVERPTEGRSPEFSVTIDGVPVPDLSYSTSVGVDQTVSTLITGLNIPDNASFEISWSSDRDNAGSGSSRQIGLSNVEVYVPSTTTIFPPADISLDLVARDVISFDVTPNADNDPVLIVTNNTNTFGAPVDGDPYSNGDPLPGGGSVYYVGPASGIPNHTGRSEGTEYFYQAWSIGTGDEYSTNFASASISTPVGVVAIPYAIDFSSNPFDNNSWIERDRLGAQSWTYNGGAEQMEMNGFASGCNDNDDWLIAPPFDLSSTNNVVIEAAISERFGGNDLLMLYSDDYDGFGDPNDYSWDVLDTIFSSATSATPVSHPVSNTDLQAISSNRVYVAFRYLSLASGSCAEWRIENFNAVLTTTPSLTTTGTPTPFSTVVGIPSAEQTIEVSGDDLQDDILVSAPTGYEVSLTSGSGFGSSVSIPFGSGTVAATDVFVRLSGAAQGTFNGNIEVTTPQAITQTIALEGQVSAAPPAITATGAAGAYFENFQDFVSAATLPDGWLVDADGSAGNRLDYSPWANGGNTNTGFKFSTANANVLGYQHTANTGEATFNLSILNQSGSTINALQVSYRGKVERTNQDRNPEFEVKIDGVSYPALAYSTADGVDSNITAIVSGLSIADNQTFEISWVSDRGTPAGTSRQIGISNVEVMIPQPATVTIEDLGNQILVGNVLQGATNHVLHQTEVVAVQNPALVTSVSFELDGTYDVADIENLKLRYSTNATLDPADPTLGTVTTIPSTGNDVVFSGLSQSIAESATGYFYLTSDIAITADVGNTIGANAPIFNFASANNNNEGTNTSSNAGLQSIISSAANAVLSSANPMVVATDLPQGDSNVVIGSFSLEVSDANVLFTEIELDFSGNFTDSDIDSVALYYTRGSAFSTDTLLVMSTDVIGAGTFAFSGFSQSILDGDLGTFYLAAFVACDATVGRTMGVEAVSPSDFSFSGTVNVTGSTSASGIHTVIPTTPDNVDNLQVSAGNQELVVSWTNPTGCLDEILVVVSENAANTGIPTGASFTADSDFGGNGDALGNGTVVYFSSGTDVTITGLTNNETYYVKVFANNAGNWSTGVEENAIPVEICFSESFSNAPAGGAFPNAGSYGNRNWTGDSGLDIDATDSRTDQSISGSSSVLIRNGRLRIQNINDGVGALTVTTQRFFAGGSGVLSIALDGAIAGTVPYSDVAQTTTITLGFPGSFDSLTISTPGNGDRVSIANLNWLCEEDADYTWDGSQWQPQTPAGNSTSTDVINVRGTNPPTLPNNSNVIARTLIINPGNDLIVGAGARVTITDSITNGGKIILEANATDGPAHLIHNTRHSGIVQANQHVTGPLPGSPDPAKWLHAGASAQVVMETLAQGSAVMNNTSVFSWNANTAQWVAAQPASDVFQPGVGYAIYAGTNQYGTFVRTIPGNITVEAEVNRGDQNMTLPLGYNDGQGNPNFPVGSTTAQTEGWNFLCNPWPAAYDLDGHPGIAFYQYRDGQYRTYIEGVTSTANDSNLVPPMGGFWIQNITGSPSSFTFDRNNRSSATGTVLKRGGGLDQYSHYIEVRANLSSNNVIERTLIRFDRDGREAFVYGEDAVKRFNDQGISNMFTYADNIPVAIQTLPLLRDKKSMPLYFDANGNESVVEISINRDTLDPELSVILEDKQLRNFEFLNQENYTFVSNAASQRDRFVLHFTYDKNVSLDEFKNGSDLKAWVFKGYLYLENPELENLTISMVDMSGRTLFTSISNHGSDEIALPNNLSAGVYLIRVSSGNGRVKTIKHMQP